MGTTANRAIPYPEPFDLVANGAAAIKALADKLDAILGADDPWHVVGAAGEPGFLNSYSNTLAPTEKVAFRKTLDMVFIRGLLSRGTDNAAAFQLPVAYRPNFAGAAGALMRIMVGNTTAGGLTQVDIGEDGFVKFKTAAGAIPAQIYVDVTFSTRAAA